MELFKFDNSDTFSGGEPIVGWDSVSWAERYQPCGEFEIMAKLSSGLRAFLPEGTLISHTRTLEVMVVENQELTEKSDEDPFLKITGRSLPCVLENRIVGQNQDWGTPPASLNDSPYILPSAYTWVQAVKLINDHIYDSDVIDPDDAIPSLLAIHDIAGVGVTEERTIKRGTVLQRLLELLAIENIGLKAVRRHGFDLPLPSTDTQLVIYAGEDKRDLVVFSTENGDIDAADYLWSIKNLKTSALVSGRYVEQMVHGPETGLSRRVMLVDGSDLDGSLDAVPTGTALTDIRAQMAIRGSQALRAQNQIALSRTDISENEAHQYRRDYNIGDVVTVDASYGPASSMRVVEFVEIVDENGVSGHPTLEFLT